MSCRCRPSTSCGSGSSPTRGLSSRPRRSTSFAPGAGRAEQGLSRVPGRARSHQVAGVAPRTSQSGPQDREGVQQVRLPDGFSGPRPGFRLPDHRRSPLRRCGQAIRLASLLMGSARRNGLQASRPVVPEDHHGSMLRVGLAVRRADGAGEGDFAGGDSHPRRDSVPRFRH